MEEGDNLVMYFWQEKKIGFGFLNSSNPISKAKDIAISYKQRLADMILSNKDRIS